MSNVDGMPEACYESAHMNCYRVASEQNPRTLEYKNNTKSKYNVFPISSFVDFYFSFLSKRAARWDSGMSSASYANKLIDV